MTEKTRKRKRRKKPQRPPRQPMPLRSPEARVQDFGEVAVGYDAETAVVEASRCLQCPTQPCVAGCPVSVDIPGFINLIKEKDFIGAAQKIKETNTLPAVCGRVCPRKNNVKKSAWWVKLINR